jgi:hypothetical protein
MPQFVLTGKLEWISDSSSTDVLVIKKREPPQGTKSEARLNKTRKRIEIEMASERHCCCDEQTIGEISWRRTSD